MFYFTGDSFFFPRILKTICHISPTVLYFLLLLEKERFNTKILFKDFEISNSLINDEHWIRHFLDNYYCKQNCERFSSSFALHRGQPNTVLSPQGKETPLLPSTGSGKKPHLISLDSYFLNVFTHFYLKRNDI